MTRRNDRTERLKNRAELVRAKSQKRKWTVFLLLTLLAIAAVSWIAFKS